MRIGVLGGTFDPVHLGHLIIAEEAREQLGLERVLFVPAGMPWRKAGDRVISPARDRLAMAKLAVASNPRFAVSTVDLERPGETYSVDTLARLREDIAPGAEFYFILGYDGLRGLPEWKEPSRLVRMCQLVVAPRPGSRPPDLRRLEARVLGIAARVKLLDMSPVGISSSAIRRRVADGRSVRYLVPPEVAKYITAHRLYRD